MIARALLLVGAALIGSAAGAAAQQPDTTLTPEEQVRQRLRSLRPVAAPDTQQVADTARMQPDRVQVDRPGMAAGPGIQRDSVMELLAVLPGYVATEYRGGEATFLADSGVLQLRREAEVVHEGQHLQADSLVEYNESTGIACGHGRPTITGATLEAPLTSDSLCYNIAARLGVARGAETAISQGANWQMRADVFTRADSMYAHDAQFTDCDLPWPHKHYVFEAGQVKVIQNNVLVARDVTMKFADVPVFWLPFLVQSLSRGRRSGILMPRFGINDIARTNARYSRSIQDVGFYLALNDYMGAEVAMDWRSDDYTGLRGSLDYNVVRQFLSGQLTFRRFWKSEGGTEFTLAASNSWQPDEFTRLSANANFASSSFVRQRTLDPLELRQSIDSNLSLGRTFSWGSLSLGATRSQFLTDGNVRTTPSAGLSINSITLFAADPGEERWYSNSSWSGNIDSRMEDFRIGSGNRDLNSQSRRNLTTNFSSRFTLGKLGLSQTFNVRDDRNFARRDSFPQGDTIARVNLREVQEQEARWAVSASYQQNLIGTTTTFTPSISLNGMLLRNDSSDQRLVAAPVRMDFNASLQTALFGFWPGVGPIERMRHRISPSFSYTYSPEVQGDSLQQAVFRGLAGGVAERNQLTIGISQTLEGKRRARDPERPEPIDAMGADTASMDTASGPRRLPPGEAPIILLSIATDAVVYDFVRAREGEGVQTQSISNSIQSDLFRNLQLRFTHDLFEEIPNALDAPADTPRKRRFKPQLSSVTASLRLDSESWLFRALGLGRGRDMQDPEGEAGDPDESATEAGPAVDRTKSELGVIGTGRRDPVGTPRGMVGTWNATLDYALVRPRDTERGFGATENQMLTANMSFQPTENWTLMWRTGYNFTIGGFTDHILTLSRRLHDWDANFDFVKAQNGNFSFMFRVHLRANPDIKLDYEQNDMGAVPRF